MNASITHPINLIIIVIGLFLNLTLSLNLILNKAIKYRANFFLALLIMCFTPTFLMSFLNRFDLLADFPHIIGVPQITLFLIGPLTYFYVRTCVQSEFVFKKLDLLHFIPFVLHFFYFIFSFNKSGEEKLQFFVNMVEQGEMLQSKLMFSLQTIHGILYIFFASRLVFIYRKHLKDTTSNIDKTFHRWVLVFLFIITFPVSALIGFGLFEFKRVVILIILLGEFTLFLAVYIATLVKPELFHTFPHILDHIDSPLSQKEKYENSALQEDQKQIFLNNLLSFMEEKKPYNDPELTLTKLSDQVKIPSHYLSQVINEKLNVNFLDFINSYRVTEIKEKLIDPNFNHFSIMAVAYDAGFNAKSTFYSVFKKQTSMTPSEFIKANQK